VEKKSNKIIHYIWFGGNPISDLTKKCIQTWKKFLPDFEIMEWNETNFDVNQCPFVKQAYEQKKWAFVADYTRFKVLEEYGGIYLDTDMEITADIAKYLELDLFMGQEDSKMINAAVVWAKEAHNPHIENIVKIYENHKQFNETGDLYDQSVPRILTKYFEQFGFDKEKDEVQVLDNGSAYIYPMEYFYPLSYDYQNNKFTDNSCMIHHFDATWISPMEKFKTKMKRKNMVWVVYVIDFFISLKNKIKFFSNHRDVITFITMFLTLMAVMLSFKPIDNTSTLSNVFNTEFSTSILQIVVISLIWTFICAKIRNIDLNLYTDKLLNRKQEDIDNGVIVNKPLDLKQTLKLQSREKLIFGLQYLVTLILTFFPVFQMAVIIPNKCIWYIALMMINLYMIYVGITKKFKYRMLELVPFGIILGALVISNFSSGLILSLCTFIFIFINMTLNKANKKRKICFVSTYVICLVIAFIVCLINSDILNSINFKFDLFENGMIENYAEYSNSETINTEFNFIKNFTNNNIKNIENNISILCNSVFYFICSILFTGLLSLLTKNRSYLFGIILIVLNSIQIVYTGLSFGFVNVILLGVIILILIQRLILKIVDEK
jgi:mannosyltransferase OCH1-like enzyme